MSETPRIVIIAGPNGAGKTTFAREFLPREGACLMFVNADLIAAGLSPFRPEAAALRAGRIMLEEIAACVARKESFAFETTLAGRGHLRRLAALRKAGYWTELMFLRLPSPEMALDRVAARVRGGGHHVPEAVVRRRFARGMANLPEYQAAVDEWHLFDNRGSRPEPLSSGGSVR